MPPKTRSSLGNEKSSRTSTTQVDDLLEDTVLTPPDSLDDTAVLATVMDSIKAAQRAIDAITLRLTTHSTSIDTVTKNLSVLADDVKEVCHTVDNLPTLFDAKLEAVSENLRSDFSTTLTTFRTDFAEGFTSYRSDTNACFKNHVTTINNLSDTVLTITKNITSIQETTLSKPEIERLIVQKWEDELDPHIKSHYDFKTEASTRLDYLDHTLQDTITTLKQYSSPSGTSTTRSSSSRSIGFHQVTSKDFSVFKLQKELKEIKLFGDNLKDLEIFWDAILGAFTNLCQTNQAYPYYRDLKSDFSFKSHLVDSIKPPRFLPIDHDQALRNYRSFGDALRIFLQSGTTIVEMSSPKTYLQLISLCDTNDGFLLLRDLIFSLSPQLSGNYHDYRQEIDNLQIISGEHLSKFYQRTIRLSNEIRLSNIPNGNMALLAYRFLVLLRSTECPTITNLVNPYWKLITKHRRDPQHLTTSLPWTFKEVYDDLISSDISTFPTLSNKAPTGTPETLFAARGFSNVTNMSALNNSSSVPSTQRSTTIEVHRTKDGRKFVSHNNKLLSKKSPLCQLCFNKHVNPWHPTENCPYKHPTQILPRDVRERVMQHNALHGAEKKDYNKTQDVPNALSSPPQATGHSATALESLIPPSTLSEQPTSDSVDSSTSHNSETPSLHDSDEIVETEYFDIPIAPAEANAATINNAATFSDIDSDSIITDHLQYLSYDS